MIVDVIRFFKGSFAMGFCVGLLMGMFILFLSHVVHAAEPKDDVITTAPMKWATTEMTTKRGDFVFMGETEREMIRIKPDGKVVLADGLSLDEASKAFWKALEQAGMFRCAETAGSAKKTKK